MQHLNFINENSGSAITVIFQILHFVLSAYLITANDHVI